MCEFISVFIFFFLSDLYVLLHLALQLTDLLLAQLVMTRRELESNQYGPFTSDLLVDNQNEDTRRNNNNSADINLERENNRTSENISRQSADRERSPRSLLEISNASNMSNASNVSLDGRDWSDVHSVTESRRQRLMAMHLKRHLKRLSRHRRGGASTSFENRTSNPTVPRPNINGDGNNLSDNIQNEDNRQSISENALSAEVQSIVERIQSSGSIDNDDRSGERTRLENRTTDTTQNSREPRNVNEGYRRIYRNTTLSEPTMRRTNESRNTQENDTEIIGWRFCRNSSIERNRRLRWNSRYARGTNLLHDQHYNFIDRRSTQDRESYRRQFNVPELQVNSMPVNDSQFDNSAFNSRRRQNAPPSPPHTPPPYLMNSSVYYNDSRNNDRMNESMNDQPGPSWIEVPNRHRVQYDFLDIRSFLIMFNNKK